MKRILILSAILIFGLSFLLANTKPAHAYSNNNMIDNAVFDSKNSMSEQDIRNFINSRPNTCLTRVGANLGGGSIYPRPVSYFSYGPTMTDAAGVIYEAAQYNDINPKVILATLQKEQSLLTDNDCFDPQGFASLPKAMGYGCFEGPGAACPPAAYAGFHQQVMKGAWQLAFDRNRAEGNVSWGGNDSIVYGGRMTQGIRKRCGSCSSIYYDGYSVIDGQNIYIENGSTAALFNYTPHLNQSFSGIFESFFGLNSTRAVYNNIAINAIGQDLVSGGVLRPGDYLISSSGNAVFTLQEDGNLVLYRNGTAVWHSNTAGRPASGVEMQTDGNLVITFAYGDKWSTSTAGNAGSVLKLQNDGNLVMYRSDNSVLWHTNTWLLPSQLIQANSTLNVGFMFRGQKLQSPNGKYRAVMQSDGNFVVYSPNRALWSSNTWNTDGKALIMQSDGNLVLYNEIRRPLWHTNTWRKGLSKLVMQDDGNLVIYQLGGLHTWKSFTAGQQ